MLIRNSLRRCISSRQAGQSLAEATAAIIILTPIALSCLNGGIYLYAISVTDEACRQAARGASMGMPNVVGKDSATTNALAALTAFGMNRGFIKIQPVFTVSESFKSALPKAPFGGPVDGSVTVTITSLIDLPCSNLILRSSALEVRSRQTLPYSWTMPPAAAENR